MREVIETGRDFVPEHILECGQVFRYRRRGNGWRVISGEACCDISPHGECYRLDCSDGDYFRSYFDLGTDYGDIKEKLSRVPLLREATQFGSGIRILRQNRFETLVSFLVSQNNHIPRIKAIIERLCDALGEAREFNGEAYRAFPAPLRLAEQSREFFSEQGLGYRAEYLAKVCKDVADGLDLEEIASLKTYAARVKLLNILGIGPKVADCILLFGYHRTDVFPVDTWIEKVYHDYFDTNKASQKQIAEYFVRKFGSFSGYAQQYLFYYRREAKK